MSAAFVKASCNSFPSTASGVLGKVGTAHNKLRLWAAVNGLLPEGLQNLSNSSGVMPFITTLTLSPLHGFQHLRNLDVLFLLG